MTDDTGDPDSETGLLAAGCEYCDWQATASSHAALVEAYQDHLRESHPKIWLRT
jgi:predicted small metal-binding protein